MNEIKVTLFGDKEPLLIAIKFLKKKIHITNIICSNNNIVENYCKKNNINFLKIKKFQKMETTNKFFLYNSDFAMSFSYPLRLSLNKFASLLVFMNSLILLYILYIFKISI